MKNDCNQPIRQFICEKCNEGYYSERAVREHYYQIHLQEYLYFCKKCGKGFYHISRKSLHKEKCPNKDGEDQYVGKAPLRQELEESFKRRTIMPIQVAEPTVPTAQEGTPQNVGKVQPDTSKQAVQQEKATVNPDGADNNEPIQPEPQETPQQAVNTEDKIEFDIDNILGHGVQQQEQQPLDFGEGVQMLDDDGNLIDQETENATGLLMAMAEGRLLGAQNVEGTERDDEDEEEDNL